MIDITKPLYWDNKHQLVVTRDEDDDEDYKVARVDGEDIQVKETSRARSYSYPFIYIYMEEDNFGWHGYEPLPLTNAKSFDSAVEQINIVKEAIADLRARGFTINCTISYTKEETL